MIEIDAMFPVMVTANLEAVKAFYESVFGFNAVFYDADFYLHLVSPNSGVQLGFLMPEHASQPDFLRPLMSPDGYVISLEVKDAAHAYAEAQKMDLTMAMELKFNNTTCATIGIMRPHQCVFWVLRETNNP